MSNHIMAYVNRIRYSKKLNYKVNPQPRFQVVWNKVQRLDGNGGTVYVSLKV